MSVWAEPCPGRGAGTRRLVGWGDPLGSVWGGVTPWAGPEGAESREPAAMLLLTPPGCRGRDGARTCAHRGAVWGHVAGKGRVPALALCPRGGELCPRAALRPHKSTCCCGKANGSADIPSRAGWGPSFPAACAGAGLLPCATPPPDPRAASRQEPGSGGGAEGSVCPVPLRGSAGDGRRWAGGARRGRPRAPSAAQTRGPAAPCRSPPLRAARPPPTLLLGQGGHPACL